MDLHISNRFEDKTEYYNLTTGTLFYLKNGEVISTEILDKLVLIEIRPSGVAIIKTSPPKGIRTTWDFGDAWRVMKAGLKTSLIHNYREVLFKILLILISTWIFYTHCVNIEALNEQNNFEDLRTLLIKKKVPPNLITKYSNSALEAVFLEVHKETVLGIRADYFDNIVKQKFKEFLLYKSGRDYLIDRVVHILSLFQPLMDYSMPFVFCDRLYSLEWNTISPLSFFIGRVLKTWLEQSTYVFIFLSLIFLVSGASFNTVDLVLMYVYSMLSTATYFAVGSFIRMPKLFYFLIVVNLYVNMLSYEGLGSHFDIIATYYRRNWVTKLLSCCFVLLPTANFQAYFYHRGVATRARMVLGNRYPDLGVQAWGVQTTAFKCLWYLLVLGGVNAGLLVVFSAFNFCCLTAK